MRRGKYLALDHVAERIDESACLERLGQLRAELATVDAIPRGDLSAERAVQWLPVLAETWVNADVPEARADLLHAIYDRIVVAGRSIVAARLTPAAYSNGLAVALPQVVVARPEGFERAGTAASVGRLRQVTPTVIERIECGRVPARKEAASLP